MSNEMSWQRIAARDPYLAGSIAARGEQQFDEETAQAWAESVGLTGERRTDFLRGWNEELAEQAKERQGQMIEEYDEMSKGAEKGDPARWL